MYRRYYSYNNMPAMPVRREECRIAEEKHCEEEKKAEEEQEREEAECTKSGGGFLEGIIRDGKIFGRFELDDVILFVVILILLLDECDDDLLLIALAFVFISGIINDEKR